MLGKLVGGVGGQELRVADGGRNGLAGFLDGVNARYHVGGAETARLERIHAHDLIGGEAERDSLTGVAHLELALRDPLGPEPVLGLGGGEKLGEAGQRLRRLRGFFAGALGLIGGPAPGERRRQLAAGIFRRKGRDVISGRDRLAAAPLATPQRLLVGDLAPIGVALKLVRGLCRQVLLEQLAVDRRQRAGELLRAAAGGFCRRRHPGGTQPGEREARPCQGARCGAGSFRGGCHAKIILRIAFALVGSRMGRFEGKRTLRDRFRPARCR